jgi:membrane protein YdbS with pleckstrin-like domain
MQTGSKMKTIRMVIALTLAQSIGIMWGYAMATHNLSTQSVIAMALFAVIIGVMVVMDGQ